MKGPARLFFSIRIFDRQSLYASTQVLFQIIRQELKPYYTKTHIWFMLQFLKKKRYTRFTPSAIAFHDLNALHYQIVKERIPKNTQ